MDIRYELMSLWYKYLIKIKLKMFKVCNFSFVLSDSFIHKVSQYDTDESIIITLMYTIFTILQSVQVSKSFIWHTGA